MYGTAEGMSRGRPNAPPPLLVVVAVASKASSLPRLPRCRAHGLCVPARDLGRPFYHSYYSYLSTAFGLAQHGVAISYNSCYSMLSLLVSVRAYGQARFVYGIAFAGRELWGFGFYRSLIGSGFGSARSMIDLITLYDSRLAGCRAGQGKSRGVALSLCAQETMASS
jgi:hypothetical protein